MFWLMAGEAALYILAAPGDPGREEFESKEDCASLTSPYDPLAPACGWDASAIPACTMHEPDEDSTCVGRS